MFVVYDEDETLVFQGSSYQVAVFLNMSQSGVVRSAQRKSRTQRKYTIEKIGRDEDGEDI